MIMMFLIVIASLPMPRLFTTMPLCRRHELTVILNVKLDLLACCAFFCCILKLSARTQRIAASLILRKTEKGRSVIF